MGSKSCNTISTATSPHFTAILESALFLSSYRYERSFFRYGVQVFFSHVRYFLTETYPLNTSELINSSCSFLIFSDVSVLGKPCSLRRALRLNFELTNRSACTTRFFETFSPGFKK